MDPRTTKLADILVNYSTEVRPGDRVAIRGEVTSLDLINETLQYTLRAGGQPMVILDSDDLMETFYREAGEGQLKYLSPIEQSSIRDVDVAIFIRGSTNTRSLTGIMCS